MGRKGRSRLRALVELVAAAQPEIEDPQTAIVQGNVLVDGLVVRNPASLVRPGASITLRSAAPLRGEVKLRAALEAFAVQVEGRIALDLGAAAGGFTRALLAAGAARVYAVDAGRGQLLGSLRQDPRVVNLEATNLGELDRTKVPDPIEVVTIDLSYLSLAAAAPQLDRVRIASGAELVALVKPQFELSVAERPTDARQLAEACSKAAAGFVRAGWRVQGTIESPVRGARGAIEFLLHARRA